MQEIKRMRFSIGERNAFLHLDIAKVTQKYIYESLCGAGYEQDTVLELKARLKPGDTFVDVGAHVGFFTILAHLLVGDSGKVIAFEADLENYSYLMANVIGLKNVTAINALIADGNEPRKFYHNADNDGGHSLWDCSTHPLNEKTKLNSSVKIITSKRLDDFSEIQNPTALKIDVEGAEVEVLRGAYDLLTCSSLRFVTCEFNGFGLKQMGHTGLELMDYLNSYGFRMLPILKNSEALIRSGYVINLFFER